MPRTRRRGTAPLEFVMVLPLLFTILVAGWWCVRAGLSKTATATDARRTAWEKRADADPGIAFDLNQKPLESAVDAETKTAVGGKSPFGGEVMTATSYSLMTDKTWDHEQYEFEELPDSPIAMHRLRLLHFGRFIPFVAEHGPSVSGFRDMDLMANSRFTREIPKALQLRVRRHATLPTFLLGPVPMGAAAAECFTIASEAPLLAPHYFPLGLMILRGIPSSVELVPVAVK